MTDLWLTVGTKSIMQSGHNGVGIGAANPISPLGIRAQGTGQELISFEDPQGTPKWHINQNLGGNNLGLNFGETDVADSRLFIKSGGNIGIGTTIPAFKLDVRGSASFGSDLSIGLNDGRPQGGKTTKRALVHYINDELVVNFNNDYTGGVRIQGQTIANVSSASDLRYKQDITPLRDALETVLAMQGVRYQWKPEVFLEQQLDEESQIGFIGQEVETLCPEVVFTNSEGYKFLDYSRLTPLLVEAIKEQQQLIEQQKLVLEKALAKIGQLEATLQGLNPKS
ncbi:tail fiber domain-containing protein [Lyngbya aestuarii]|uniref:tail fiber domain-containing protein n=1 Tax=Lyngbya aestuarii TaxID=118322 RepID=UPI00403E2DAD